MKTLGTAVGFSRLLWKKQDLAFLLLIALLCAIGAPKLSVAQDTPPAAQAAQAPAYEIGRAHV